MPQPRRWRPKPLKGVTARRRRADAVRRVQLSAVRRAMSSRLRSKD